MRFNKLDLNLLVALDALLTERNITRAAERVNGAVRRRDFPVRCHRHVDEDERQLWTLGFGLWTHKISIASP